MTSSNTNAQQLQGQGSTSDLPPLYTAGSSQAQAQSQSHTQPPFYFNLESTQDAVGAAHWSPYDSTVNLAQHTHPDQHHPHRHHMGLTSTEHHSHSSDHPHGPHHHKDKDKPSLSVILDAPFIALKGTGPDVEPTTLSGHVVLFLTEATALKELTLQFRGKAKIPMPANESLINSATSITYVVCNHDWSFLESSSSSSKRHSRTLKAGKHYFPFSLSIGGSLPSSISSPALGGASVAYKLRAVAVRPGLAHNLQCIQPVPILRSFTPEALEYQQTLEIENTWPDKIMYAIMLPHKAWAAGDALGAVVKFSPLAKGVRVVSVISSLAEITKVYARSGAQEDTRVVCSARHEILGNGKAVEVEVAAGMLTGGAAHAATVGTSSRGEGSSSGHRLGSAFGNLTHIVSSHNSASSSQRNLNEDGESHMEHGEEGYENNDVVTYIKLRLPCSSTPTPTPPGGHSPASGSGHVTPSGTGTSTPSTPGFPAVSAGPSANFTSSSTTVFAGPHFVTTSSWTPPNVLVTPSHTLEPITVSHRIRWSIYIRNRDGHISELRCSLPLVILDGRLKSEARDASLMSRRMMARSCNIVPERGDEEFWGLGVAGADGGEGGEGDGEAQADRELPSYTAHVRDRVANMFLPEAVTMRVSNPWLGRVSAGESGLSSPNPSSPAAVGEPVDPLAITHATEEQAGSERDPRRNSSYANLEAHAHAMSQLPHVPASGTSTPLDWVNSELLLSLGDDSLRRFGVDSGVAGHAPGSAGAAAGDGALTPMTPAGVRTPPPPAPLQYVSSGPGSRPGSRWGSRAGSRASSPERGGDSHHHRRQQSGDHFEQRISRPGSPTFGASSSGSAHHSGPAALGYIYEPLPSGSGSGPAGQHPHSSSSTHPHHPDHGHAHGHGHSYGHGHHGGRLGSFFKATMKPFTALSSHKHRHDEHKEGAGGSGPNSREGSPPGGGRGHFELDRPSSVPPRGSPFHASQPDLSIPSAMVATPSVEPAEAEHLQTLPSAALSTSRSTSNLPAMRLAAAQHTSPYGQVPITAAAALDPNIQTQSQPTLPIGNPPVRTLLQRALTEVPDYAVASRGFLGGVPPLTSMRGLPSYEEAVAHAHAHVRPAGSAVTVSEPMTGGVGTPSQNSASDSAHAGPSAHAPSSLSRSEPDIVGRFAQMRLEALSLTHAQTQRSQTEGDGDGEEDNDGEDDEGIQMRSSHTRGGQSPTA